MEVRCSCSHIKFKSYCKTKRNNNRIEAGREQEEKKRGNQQVNKVGKAMTSQSIIKEMAHRKRVRNVIK